MIRWTATNDSVATLSHVLDVLSKKTGQTFTEKDFLLQDDRGLAFNHYQRYEQIVAGDLVEGRSLRLWRDANGRLVQAEAYLNIAGEKEASHEMVVFETDRLKDAETVKIAQKAIKHSRDPYFRGIEWKDRWLDGRFVRIVTVKGKHGKTKLVIHHRSKKVLSNDFAEFPQGDLNARDISPTQSIQTLVYPIYEETEGALIHQDRIEVTLDHILAEIPNVPNDLYAEMKTRRYMGEQFSPVQGESEAGRAAGFWSMTYLKNKAASIRGALPLIGNDFEHGLMLQGSFATINIHPDAFTKFPGVTLAPKPSAAFFPNWLETADNVEMVPGNAFYGKPLMSATEAMNRPARRLADHNPAEYLNDGFDEIQVYYAINTLFNTLHDIGFSDPELSTRPFNAFLFNPDIEYRDNAFYTDDTINFTTYSPKAQNYARDNSTIWHELGHGVMDRLMGDNLTLADSGGLAEGMADFVAAMVIQGVTKGAPFDGSRDFRIINHTGFNLTNESHDDGEAYGGAMKDFMDAAVLADKDNGLHKVADIVLEAMRLSRDHPKLDANEWFNHILFADSLGRDGLRKPGEMHNLIVAALNGRNFRLDGGQTATLSLKNDQTNVEITSSAIGSRYKPIVVTIKKDETKELKVGVSIKSSPTYAFKYPVTVKFEYLKSPLQGSVHWVGEESSPAVYTLKSESDTLHIPVTVTGTCDAINREDGTCSDYIHVQIFNDGETDKPSAKKRFYVQIKNP
ncbi:MAG: hypothetical protein JST80_02815 [Bdellovibrionales bacterium]|nr:hypothetical protein [Bdellovibrionales bacterium]